MVAFILALWTAFVSAAETPRQPDVSGDEIVQKCGFKYAGNDQKTRLKILLRDSQGKERVNIYRRLWKNYQTAGEDQVADKMLLFTEFPPDAKGAAFMRWAYRPGAAQSAEQWIYLPVLAKTRRVSIRDLSESFLGSDLTYGDISARRVEDDMHTLLQILPGRSAEYFVVESIPKDSGSQYGRKVQWYSRTPQWDGCLNLRTDFYDRKGDLLKRQFIRWQKIRGAWVWDTMLVENVQTYHTSRFVVDEVSVNTGIEDWLFSERSLRTSEE